MLTLLLLLTASAAEVETQRLQIDGEWCWIKIPAQRKPGIAVLAIHGNGQTVTAKSSSFEEGAGFRRLTDALTAQGYLVAQSNHGATADNGMWGNARTQSTVVALAKHLRTKYGVKRFHALAVSAGGATLMNLALDRDLRFETALLIVPVISLESMYRCPGGMDRVKGLSEAFGFQAASACPGDPAKDAAFRKATDSFDPLRRMAAMPPGDLRARLKRTRWMGILNTGDPRVLPKENILPMADLFRRAGLEIGLKSMDLDTHSADQPLAKYEAEILDWMRARR